MEGLFQNELTELLNKYSKPEESDTPDGVLAQFVTDSLQAFNRATRQREEFHGRTISGAQTQNWEAGAQMNNPVAEKYTSG